MPLKSNALITLDYAKEHLGIPSGTTSVDSRVETIINAASGMIERYCRRILVTQAHEQFSDGRGQNKLLLHEYPVASVQNLYIDQDSVFSATTLIDTDDYALEKESVIVMLDRTLPRGYRNIKVEYTAGYGVAGDGNIPSDIEWACAELVSWFYNSTSNHRIGIISQGKQNENVTFEQTLPGNVKLFLEPYVRIEFADASVQIRNT